MAITSAHRKRRSPFLLMRPVRTRLALYVAGHLIRDCLQFRRKSYILPDHIQIVAALWSALPKAERSRRFPPSGASPRGTAYFLVFPTSGLGSATKPSRLGIFTLGSDLASITSVSPIMPLRFRMYAVTA